MGKCGIDASVSVKTTGRRHISLKNHLIFSFHMWNIDKTVVASLAQRTAGTVRQDLGRKVGPVARSNLFWLSSSAKQSR